MRYALAILTLALGFSPVTWAEGEKQDKAYVGWRVTDLEFRSVRGDKQDNIMGTELVLGSYLTDYIRVEGRLGTGLNDATPEPGLDVTVKGYASWFMGIQYPVTEAATVYALYGFSFVKGDASREDPRSFPEIPDKFFDSSFSASYAFGFDYEIVENWLANFEFGRIHRDSATKVRTMQLGLGIKYEF